MLKSPVGIEEETLEMWWWWHKGKIGPAKVSKACEMNYRLKFTLQVTSQKKQLLWFVT